tara:strand:+ start:781 stop:1047 length:267 start_codon:yes stop_codon:yes gene_type:complete
MKLNKEDLKEMIREAMNLKEWTGDEMEAAKGDMTQEYINFLVAVQESAREALEDIERGVEPYEAATQSRFNTLVRKFTDEEFYDFFFG